MLPTNETRRRTRRDDDGDESLPADDPPFQPEDEDFDSEEDEGGDRFDAEVQEVLKSLPADQRATMQRQMASYNNTQKDLETKVDDAVARAGAQMQVQSEEIVKAIEWVVKTWLLRTCKFITTEEDLTKATDYVFTKTIHKIPVPTSVQDAANRNFTYRTIVSKKLCTRRSYHQSELRKAALRWGKGMAEPGEKAEVDDDATTLGEEENTPTIGTTLVERPLFSMEMMIKCATRYV